MKRAIKWWFGQQLVSLGRWFAMRLAKYGWNLVWNNAPSEGELVAYVMRQFQGMGFFPTASEAKEAVASVLPFPMPSPAPDHVQ